jgi:hypothetical protein
VKKVGVCDKKVGVCDMCGRTIWQKWAWHFHSAKLKV